MKAIPASPLHAAETPRAVQKLVVYAPASQMVMWEEEVNFYRSLLTWWLHSCREENRVDIEALMAELNNLREFNLAASKEKLGVVQSQTSRANFQGWETTADLRDSFYYFDQKLSNLKSKIFQGFTRFGHVQIW